MLLKHLVVWGGQPPTKPNQTKKPHNLECLCVVLQSLGWSGSPGSASGWEHSVVPRSGSAMTPSQVSCLPQAADPRAGWKVVKPGLNPASSPEVEMRTWGGPWAQPLWLHSIAFPWGRRDGVKFLPDPKLHRGCHCLQRVLNRLPGFVLCQYNTRAAGHEESRESFLFWPCKSCLSNLSVILVMDKTNPLSLQAAKLAWQALGNLPSPFFSPFRKEQ